MLPGESAHLGVEITFETTLVTGSRRLSNMLAIGFLTLTCLTERHQPLIYLQLQGHIRD